MIAEPPISQVLARYARAFTLDRLPEKDRAHLVDAFVNWVGCALGGAAAPPTLALGRTYETLAPGGAWRVLGSQRRYGLVEAVAMDCLASAVLAFDDTHLETVLHPTGPVAAALLGQARLQPVTGAEFLAALHVGMEIECRAGLAITGAGSGAKRGWYLTGVTGGIGAAAGVAHLLGLDEPDMLAALGMAAVRAAGNRGSHGSMAASYVPSLAAESGFMAAHLVRAGMGCGARAFDGPAGLLELVTERPAIERALAGLGTVSEAARTAFKPYPSGIVTHPVIDACLSLVHDHGVGSDDLAALDFTISRTANDLVANKYPDTVIEAQVSLFYWGAVALATGAAGQAQAWPGMMHDPLVCSLQDRMTSSVDPAIADDACVAQARLTNGTTIKVVIERATGSLERPMSSAVIDAKFMELAEPVLGAERAGRLLETCRDVARLERVDRILDI